MAPRGHAAHLAATTAAITRHHGEDDSRLPVLREQLAAEKVAQGLEAQAARIREWAAAQAAAAPELTPAVADRLALAAGAAP
jgi:hypothetical protein